MTQARMDWKQMELTLDGHADYAPKGQDIVCAAVSILAQSLIAGLNGLAKYGMAHCKWNGDPAEGRMTIKASVCWANLGITRAYFEMAVAGLKLLAEKYPENITLEEVK